MMMKHVGQERDGLDGLSQSHLISKYNTVAPEEEEDKQTLFLTVLKQLLFQNSTKTAVFILMVPAPGVSQPIQPS